MRNIYKVARLGDLYILLERMFLFWKPSRPAKRLQARQFLLWLEMCLANVTVLKPSTFVLRLKPGKQKGKALKTQTRAPGRLNYHGSVRCHWAIIPAGQIAGCGGIPGKWKVMERHQPQRWLCVCEHLLLPPYRRLLWVCQSRTMSGLRVVGSQGRWWLTSGHQSIFCLCLKCDGSI